MGNGDFKLYGCGLERFGEFKEECDYMCFGCESDAKEEIATIQMDASRVVSPLLMRQGKPKRSTSLCSS